ncbi:metallophosphoesterase [Crenothrix polyspora]|uniref:Putative 3',5'-cyclic adenosine monophosphate phosphodiesterase CpdA n=1 Tax=Crenothrix polyspora TaxID=360316 RepID=A0A1R4HAX9_9GAMM|nr:metallophosphoesterase [Crenothrix polyspora]SJM93326.1 putative 3',5'-cyclic adenosine monophosphate phosphodiesterase CpdA [Crenothrix polyspora]
MTQGYTTVLQLTDLHLFAEQHGVFNGVNTRNSYNQVLNHVRQHYSTPDVIVITGDLAHDNACETYQYIADSLKVFNAPVYCVLGNHDHSKNAYRVYPLAPVTTDLHCVFGQWQIVLLDSNHQPEAGSYQGEVSAVELQRVGALLSRYPKLWTLIAMHHNLPQHDDRGVAIEVRNHQQVMAYFEQQPNIKVVLSGHVHQEFVIVQNGVCYLSTPATGYQSTSRSGQVTGEAPGYRWLKLYDNGRFETDVRRVAYWVS